MAALRIIGMGLGAAVLYGILHDQVTARVCVEYFTVGHPRVMESDSPTLLALYWGVVATWWVGLPAGILLAIAARAGREPRRGARELLRPLMIQLAAMAVLALAAGVAGYACYKGGLVRLVPPLADRLPRERHGVYIADLWAHLASYASGALGTLILCLHTLWRRFRPPDAKLPAPNAS